ncbi:unnamed protein product [Rotaria magnacalcarata]|uniref:Uncharacterized protein n=1 Tax=Rotaria magnacalcarata TaxID=392030 RepID=A0A816KU18_9BILA|nr:unnamed protein product [Rotaria magnacalcarata]
MFDTTCRSGLKGRFSSLKWKWDARFSCDNYSFVGCDTQAGRPSAVEGAINDWVNQATNAGVFTSADQFGKNNEIIFSCFSQLCHNKYFENNNRHKYSTDYITKATRSNCS